MNQTTSLHTKPAFSVCVYCGSRPGTDPAFAQAATQVGQWIGSHGGQLVYGGGKNGLMGIVAQATKAAGGRVLGIIPTALVDKEMANHDCDELIVVDNMHQRKALMAENSDVFLAIPGGIGTFEELFEIWTWRQLGYHNKPVGILNTNGYYDALQTFLNHSTRNGLMDQWQMDLIANGTEPEALLPILMNQAAIDTTDPNLLRQNM